MHVPASRPAEAAAPPPVRTGQILFVVGLALMAVVSAVSGLNIALPTLARDTGASQTELTWIVDAYTVSFAGLLLFAGALGDRYGRKQLLVLGLIVYGIAAALALFTTDPMQLIAERALMGLGAAGVMPTTLSVITTSFPEAERPHAIGIWVGIAGGGAVLGLFASGLLLEYFSWQSFFALNVVLAALACVGTLAIVPSSAEENRPALDVVGAVLSLVTVAAMVFAIIEGPDLGWTDPLTLLGAAAGGLGLVAFVAWELRVEAPLLDPRLFRIRGFSAGSLTVAVQFFAAFGFFFTAIQYLQFVTGRSPLEAAIALLPLPVVLLPVARNAPTLAARVGFRRVATLGLVASALGLLIMSRLEINSPYWYFAAGLAVFAAGMGLAGTPATTAITESLPISKQGVASAVNDTSRELGSALGIAILGSVLNQQYRDGMAHAVSGLPPAIADRVLGTIAFTASPIVAQLGERGQQLVNTAEQAFVHGVGDALLVAAIILLAVAAIVFVRAPVPGRLPLEEVALEELPAPVA